MHLQDAPVPKPIDPLALLKKLLQLNAAADHIGPVGLDDHTVILVVLVLVLVPTGLLDDARLHK